MRTRAAQLVELGRMECVETQVEAPGEGDVLVHSRYASICGSDLHIVYDGIETSPELWAPGYPGHEGIGEVLESRRDGFVPGDLVLSVPDVPEARCFAETQRVRGGSLVRLDGDLPPIDQVLMAQQLGTVIFAMRQHPADVAGATVVVLGQGSAGLFWSFLLKRAGAARVIVADLSPSRLAASAGFGADVLLQPPRDDVASAVQDLTGGQGADYVVEAVGRRDSFLLTPRLVKPGGTVYWFGLPDSKAPIPMDFRMFFRRRLTAHTVYGAQGEAGLVSFRVAVEMIRRREIDVTPLLSHVLPIEDVGKAFDLAQERHEGALKVSLAF